MKTLRLILTLQCNLSCSYCCNKLESVNSKFQEKLFTEIDFIQYEAVCLTGGEPLLNQYLLLDVVESICRRHPGIPVYLYTNGILLNRWLVQIGLITGINIGIHSQAQLHAIHENLKDLVLHPKLRWLMEDQMASKIEFPFPVRNKQVKLWKRNQCEMPNEDWVKLKSLN